MVQLDDYRVGVDARNNRVKKVGKAVLPTDGLSFALPAYTTTELDDLETKEAGMLAYNTTTEKLNTFDGSSWSNVGASASDMNPIGTIREFAVATNPATLLGFGTWTAHGAGRVTVGLDSGDADYDTVDETGGAKTKTISTANLPAHTHGSSGSTGTVAFHGSGSATALAGASGIFTTGTARSSYHTNASSGGATSYDSFSLNTAHTHTSVGSGTALDVKNPYIVVYRWVRTA